MKEGKLTQYETRLARYYPGMGYETLTVIDQSRQRIVLNDTDVDDLIVKIGFEVSTFGQTIILNDRKLITPLAQRLAQYDPDRTTFVFPGRAGKRMDTLIDEGTIPKEKRIFVGTSRQVSESGKVSGVTLTTEVDIEPGQEVVVVDDVIMSGSTLSAVRRRFGDDRKYFASSLLALSPIQNQYGFARFGSGIQGYYGVDVNTVYQGASGTPSVISLSSLVGESEKSKEIQEAYKRKFAKNTYLFDNTLEEVKSFMQL